MDFLLDDSRDDRLLEDYLFSGYRFGSKQVSDQQFAKPIEDEDLFGVNNDNEELMQDGEAIDGIENSTSSPIGHNNVEDADFEKTPIGGNTSDVLCDRDLNSLGLFDGELVDQSSVEKNVQEKPVSESELDIDDIFADDYSQSPEPIKPQTDYSKNNNAVIRSENSRSNPIPQPSPIQIKKQKLLEKLREQVKAKSLHPKKLGTGFNEDNSIEVIISGDKMTSSSDSKFFFNKLFNKSKKANDSGEVMITGTEKTWDDYNTKLRKRICAQKRKIWDSFQRPVDDFDEEEEFVELNEAEDSNSNQEGEETKNEDEASDEEEGCDFGNLSQSDAEQEGEVDDDDDVVMDDMNEEEEEEEVNEIDDDGDEIESVAVEEDREATNDSLSDANSTSDSESQVEVDKEDTFGQEDDAAEEVSLACDNEKDEVEKESSSEDDNDDDDDDDAISTTSFKLLDDDDDDDDDGDDDDDNDNGDDQEGEEEEETNSKRLTGAAQFIDNEALDRDDSDDEVVIRRGKNRRVIEIEEDDDDDDNDNVKSNSYALFS